MKVPDVDNTEIMKYTIQTLIKIMGRRTSENFAYSTLNKIIDQLSSKYDFLKYIKINDTTYSEDANTIATDTEINKVNAEEMVKCIKELADLVTSAIGENADYFFIREVRDNFSNEYEPKVKDFLLNLNMRQFEYLVKRKEEKQREMVLLQIKNSEVVTPVITTLIELLIKITSKEDALQIVNTKIQNNLEKFNCLQYVYVVETPDSSSFFAVETTPSFDTIVSAKVAEALSTLIADVGKSVEWNEEHSFIEDFKKVAGEKSISKMSRKGINLNQVDAAIRHSQYNIAMKTVNAIFDILISKTSKKEAITMLGETITLLQGLHNILDYIKINSSDNEESIFIVLPEINSVEIYKLGMALRDVITIIQENHKNIPLIEEFKIKLGDEYLAEIEKLGVNLHFLELKYTPQTD